MGAQERPSGVVSLLGIESGVREAGGELLLKGVCASWGCSNQQPQLGGLYTLEFNLSQFWGP